MASETYHTYHKSIRLKDYDYSQPGGYFITVCTANKQRVFGNISNDQTDPNRFGLIVREEWLKTAAIRPYVELDAFVVMPNHFHGILLIAEDSGATQRVAATRTLRPHSVGSIIGQFKSASTKSIRRSGLETFAWQRNFYEHIIRNEDDLAEIREYIIGNPAKWSEDEDNPERGIP